MAFSILLFLFAVAIVQLLWRWLTNCEPKEPKNKPRDRQEPFNLLDFDEFADIMDEDDERGQK